MQKLILFFLAVLCLNACTPRYYNVYNSGSAFQFQHKEKYADKLEEGSTLIASGYHFTVEELPTGEFIKKIFYPDTRQLTEFSTYTDKLLRNKNGRYINYWDDGTLNLKGDYVNNNKNGAWVDYAGYYKGKGEYANGEKTGLWVTEDSLGNKIAEYNYKENKMHGAFKRWDKSGKLINEGIYEMGDIISEKDYTEEKEGEIKEVFKVVETFPRFPSERCDKLSGQEQKACSDEVMLRFIYGNIKYPAKAREEGVDGMAIVSFVVNKDGSISDIECKRGICKEIKEECIRIVKTMPKWNPGMQDGEPVRVHFRLPVKFKLE